MSTHCKAAAYGDHSLSVLHTGVAHVLLQALIEFENVVSLEPKNYVGDNFSRVTDIYRVSQYNMGCCYSVLDQVRSSVIRHSLQTGSTRAHGASCYALEKLPCAQHAEPTALRHHMWCAVVAAAMTTVLCLGMCDLFKHIPQVNTHL